MLRSHISFLDETIFCYDNVLICHIILIFFILNNTTRSRLYSKSINTKNERSGEQKDTENKTTQMLQLEFKLADDLEKSLYSMKSKNTRAIIAYVNAKGDTLEQLGESMEFGGTLEEDLAVVREGLEDIDKALLVLRTTQDKPDCCLLLLVSPSVKPKDKMMIATASTYIRKTVDSAGECKITGSDYRVDDRKDILPTLFGVTEEEKESLRTESEKAKLETEAQLAKEAKEEGEKAPRPLMGMGGLLGMSGKACLPESTKEALQKIGKDADEGGAVIIRVHPKTGEFDVSETVSADGVPSKLAAAVPPDAPRFIVTCWPTEEKLEGKVLLLYVCPPDAKPKEKMPYAAAKRSLKTALVDAGLDVAHSFEFDTAENLAELVKAELSDATADLAAIQDIPEKKEDPKDRFKGMPRMFM